MESNEVKLNEMYGHQPEKSFGSAFEEYEYRQDFWTFWSVFFRSVLHALILVFFFFIGFQIGWKYAILTDETLVILRGTDLTEVPEMRSILIPEGVENED